MNLEIFHLNPRSSFHFGVRGVGMEATTDYAPSDTLFGALCSTIRYIYGKSGLESILEKFATRQPHFQCGGAYPFARTEDAIIRFYPVPLSLMEDVDSTQFETRDFKKLRKAQWVSEAIFQQWLTRKSLRDVHLLESVKALVTRDDAQALVTHFDALLNQHNILTDKQKQGMLNQPLISAKLPLWQSGDVPRVAVDRVTSAGNIFRAGRFMLADDVGLWVGFHYQDDTWCENHLPSILHQLGDWGMGGERSSGYGQFDIDTSENIRIAFPDPSQHEYFVNLAYYYPTEQEHPTLDGNAAYDLDLRRGWMSNPESRALRRKAIRMVKMGSLMQSLEGQDVYGSLVDVTPTMFDGGYTIYRNGYALAIGVQRA